MPIVALGAWQTTERETWARCERSIHYTPSAISCPPCLPVCRFVVYATLFQSVYCRAREYGTRSFIIARVTNRFFPATDIGRISKLLHLRRRRVSLIMFLLRLQVVPRWIFMNTSIETSTKLKERMRVKRVGNRRQIVLYFRVIGSKRGLLRRRMEEIRGRLLR